jgi:hypothetical protein
MRPDLVLSNPMNGANHRDELDVLISELDKLIPTDLIFCMSLDTNMSSSNNMVHASEEEESGTFS